MFFILFYGICISNYFSRQFVDRDNFYSFENCNDLRRTLLLIQLNNSVL